MSDVHRCYTCGEMKIDCVNALVEDKTIIRCAQCSALELTEKFIRVVCPRCEEPYTDRVGRMDLDGKEMCEACNGENRGDMVNHPSHYKTDGGLECIDAMEAMTSVEGFVAHCKLCAIKYIWRDGKKDNRIQELKKAEWYLKRAISTLEKK